jgi:hypothetical protein
MTLLLVVPSLVLVGASYAFVGRSVRSEPADNFCTRR